MTSALDNGAMQHQPVLMGAFTKFPVVIGLLVFLVPAIAGLASESWQTEAGSLAPIVLCLGGWTIANAVREARADARPGSLLLWAVAMAAAMLAYLFASAISMVSLMALAAWAGGVASLYALYGWPVIRRCLVPIAFLALAIPLPYMLSAPLNFAMRDWLSETAVALAAAMGMDVALDNGMIAVGPYLLSIENACAGASSTISLIAIGLLFAYWVQRTDARGATIIVVAAIPIALIANLLRVVALMALVAAQGPHVVDTAVHPLSGVISFTLALGLLLAIAKMPVPARASV